MGSRLSLVRLAFQFAESNDSDRRLTPSWSPSDGRISRSWNLSKSIKTNTNRLAAIRLMIMATTRNLRQWRRMKLGRASVVTGHELRLTRIRFRAKPSAQKFRKKLYV